MPTKLSSSEFNSDEQLLIDVLLDLPLDRYLMLVAFTFRLMREYIREDSWGGKWRSVLPDNKVWARVMWDRCTLPQLAFIEELTGYVTDK